MTAMDDAERAKDDLAQKLLGQFSVNSVGVGVDDDGNFCILVGTERELTADERRRLPQQHNGVRVKYHVNGPIRAL